MALFWHRTSSVIDLLEEHVNKTRDVLDRRIFNDLMLNKGSIRRLAQEHGMKPQDIQHRLRTMMVELKDFLSTVGIDHMADIDLSS
jgi:hypothetical protein